MPSGIPSRITTARALLGPGALLLNNSRCEKQVLSSQKQAYRLWLTHRRGRSTRGQVTRSFVFKTRPLHSPSATTSDTGFVRSMYTPPNTAQSLRRWWWASHYGSRKKNGHTCSKSFNDDVPAESLTELAGAVHGDDKRRGAVDAKRVEEAMHLAHTLCSLRKKPSAMENQFFSHSHQNCLVVLQKRMIHRTLYTCPLPF